MNVLFRFQVTVLLCALIVGILADALRCEEKEKILVTLGKETTLITAPLRKSGYPDYLEALNKHQSTGVTPENNIVVALLRMTGPAKIKPEIAKEYFKRLGIAPLPTDGRYLQTYEDFVKALPDEKLPKPNKTESEIEDANVRNETIRERLKIEEEKLVEPWTAQDYPIAAEWLKAQEPLLALLNDYEMRTKYYSPFVEVDGKGLVGHPLFIPEHMLVAKIESIKIASLLGSGDQKAAWQEVRKVFQIVKSFRNSPTSEEQLQGHRIYRSLLEGVLTYAVQDPALTLKDLEQMKKDFDSIPPMELGKSLDLTTRFMYLDTICRYAERGFDPAWFISGEKWTIKEKKPFEERSKYNFDKMLRLGNTHIDQYVELSRIVDPEKFRKRYHQLGNVGTAIIKELTDPVATMKDLVSPEGMSIRVANATIREVTMNPTALLSWQTRFRGFHEMQMVGIALASYHKKHQRYPLDFTELKSEGIQQLPQDLYLDYKYNLIYKCDGSGFILYSPFMDMCDSGGFNGTSSDNDSHDDIATFSLNRIPKPPKMKRELPRPK